MLPCCYVDVWECILYKNRATHLDSAFTWADTEILILLTSPPLQCTALQGKRACNLTLHWLLNGFSLFFSLKFPHPFPLCPVPPPLLTFGLIYHSLFHDCIAPRVSCFFFTPYACYLISGLPSYRAIKSSSLPLLLTTFVAHTPPRFHFSASSLLSESQNALNVIMSNSLSLDLVCGVTLPWSLSALLVFLIFILCYLFTYRNHPNPSIPNSSPFLLFLIVFYPPKGMALLQRVFEVLTFPLIPAWLSVKAKARV